MDKSWIIRAEQIRKTYGSGDTAVRALRETSLQGNPPFSTCWAASMSLTAGECG